jgi:hypothetical protein
MKKSPRRLARKNKADESALVFPAINDAEIRTVSATLAEVIQMSEEMLPFENKRRKPSGAAYYPPFVLR